MWSSVCSNIASFRPATLLTMKSFVRLSQGLIYRRSEEQFILQNTSQWLLRKSDANH